MPYSLRLVLKPLPTPSEGQTRAVTGVQVSLVRHGKGLSEAQVGTESAATLRFSADFLASALEPETRETHPLASVSGSVTFRPGNAAPAMSLTDFAALQGSPGTVHEGTTPRQLEVRFDPANFPGLPVGPFFLTLPDPGEAKHVEVRGALEVAGSDEAPLDANDTLDVPLRPRETYAVRLVDELGEPLVSVALEFRLGNVVQTVVTDANGTARTDTLGSGTAIIRVVDPASARAELVSRWKQARPGVYVHPAPGVLVSPHTELDQPVTLVTPTLHLWSVQPVVKEARILGLLFPTNKSFVVPEAIPGMRLLAQMYGENPGAHLLVVGHTDTTAEPDINDPLSLERAESVAAFLRDDVETWLGRYDSGPASRRWGPDEDLSMLAALTLSANGSGVLSAALVETFQRSHNALPEEGRSRHFATLAEDGKLGPETRRQLIADYMNRDGTSLPDDVQLTTHGCGENYPLDASGAELDSNAAQGQRDASDRRVELFFFDGELGILPPPPGKNSKKDSPEYPEWRRRARETRELEVSARGPLDFSTFAPADVEPTLVISDERGARVAALDRSHAVQEDDVLRFSMLPEVLPARVELAVLRDGRVDRETGLFDPVALRDSLFFGDLDKAQDDLSGRPVVTQASFARTNALGSAASARPALQQKLRILIRWDNPNHRFLRNRLPAVTPTDGSAANTTLPLANGSTPGRAGFDIPDDATRFEVRLEIRSAFASLLDLRQRYRVLRPANNRPSILPESSNSSSFQHPRIHSAAYTAGPPGTTVIEVVLDVLFLDVTAHVLALPTKASVGPFEAIGRFSAVEKDKTAFDIQSKLRILEFTGGQPTTWPVILPPNLPARLDHGVLLFLKNEALASVDGQGLVVENRTHRNSDDLQYFQALVPWWASPRTPGHYVDSRGGGEYLTFPRFGWDKKLRESGKTPVVLFPVPHGASMGVLDQPTQKSRTLVERALLCLFADGHVQTGSSALPVVRHLAVGAWSSGTDTLFKWVPVSAPKTSKLVDELWVFDGKKGFPVDLEGWFRANPARKLRVIGTAYTEVAANALKQRLSGQPNVFVHPGDPKYWYQNPDYKQALSDTRTGNPLQFRSSPTAPLTPNDASRLSNIFLASDTLVDRGISVDQTLTLFSPGLGRAQISPISHEEAATLIVLGFLLAPGPGPVRTREEFRAAVRRATTVSASEPHETFRHRHSWSVFGGLFNHKGRPFVGYFQLCLEESGL